MDNSKLDLGLGQFPLEPTASEDVLDLYRAVHTLHRKLSALAGLTIFDPAEYKSIPVTSTVHSQSIDRMYVKTMETVVAGDFIKIVADGTGGIGVAKALYDNTAVGSCVHGVVMEVFAGGYAIVTRGGIVDAYSGLTIGADYYLSSTVAGGYQTVPPGSKPCQRIGLGVSATAMYVSVL